MIELNDFGQVLGNPVINWHDRALPGHTIMIGNYCLLEPLDVGLHEHLLFQSLCIDTPESNWTYLPFGPFKECAEFEQWLSDSSQSKLFFTIIDQASHIPQGLASYHDIDPVHGTIEVGSVIFSKQLQGTRVATEAMYLMMKHVFDDRHYRRYEWCCNALNEKSRRAAVRLGFTFEGIFRQARVFKERNRDTAWYSIINSEWPALKSRFEQWLDPSNFDLNGRQIKKLNDFLVLSTATSSHYRRC
jgi:RimJ/RimL family protein N-acetyltransferase